MKACTGDAPSALFLTSGYPSFLLFLLHPVAPALSDTQSTIMFRFLSVCVENRVSMTREGILKCERWCYNEDNDTMLLMIQTELRCYAVCDDAMVKSSRLGETSLFDRRNLTMSRQSTVQAVVGKAAIGSLTSLSYCPVTTSVESC